MKKYEITTEQHPKNPNLFRIRALTSIPDVVKAGELGGWIEKEANLRHQGACWVYGNAEVCGNAQVYGLAKVYGHTKVYGDAQIGGDARVYGNAQVGGNARVYGYTKVYGHAEVYGRAEVYGHAEVYGNAQVYDLTKVYGDAEVYGRAKVSGDAEIKNSRDMLHVIGLRYPLTITPQNVMGGCRLFTHEEFSNLTLLGCQDREWAEEELAIYKSVLELYRRSRSRKNEILSSPRHSLSH